MGRVNGRNWNTSDKKSCKISKSLYKLQRQDHRRWCISPRRRGKGTSSFPYRARVLFQMLCKIWWTETYFGKKQVDIGKNLKNLHKRFLSGGYISGFQIAGVPERSKGQGLGVIKGIDKMNIKYCYQQNYIK